MGARQWDEGYQGRGGHGLPSALNPHDGLVLQGQAGQREAGVGKGAARAPVQGSPSHSSCPARPLPTRTQPSPSPAPQPLVLSSV